MASRWWRSRVHLVAADLTGVDLKIERAKRHLAHLRQAIDARVNPDVYRFELNRDSQSSKHILSAHDVPTVDPKWSLESGEILFNLRSALDHLAWQLVILDGQTPGEQTQFPIREMPFNKKGVLTTTQLSPEIKSPQILKALEEVQPYYGPDFTPEPPSTGPLWQLNNIDKHRLLLVVLVALDVGKMWWGGPPAPDFGLCPGPVTEGAPVAWFDFHGEEPPLGFDPHPALHIRFNEPEIPFGANLVDVTGYLDMLCKWVGPYTIDTYFRPLFP
jgi:hypothetical protein